GGNRRVEPGTIGVDRGDRVVRQSARGGRGQAAGSGKDLPAATVRSGRADPPGGGLGPDALVPDKGFGKSSECSPCRKRPPGAAISSYLQSSRTIHWSGTYYEWTTTSTPKTYARRGSA